MHSHCLYIQSQLLWIWKSFFYLVCLVRPPYQRQWGWFWSSISMFLSAFSFEAPLCSTPDTPALFVPRSVSRPWFCIEPHIRRPEENPKLLWRNYMAFLLSIWICCHHDSQRGWSYFSWSFRTELPSQAWLLPDLTCACCFRNMWLANLL